MQIIIMVPQDAHHYATSLKQTYIASLELSRN